MVLVSTIHFRFTSAHFKGAPHLKVCTVVLHAPRSDSHLSLVLLLTPSAAFLPSCMSHFFLWSSMTSPLASLAGGTFWSWVSLLEHGRVCCMLLAPLPSPQLESDLSWSFIFSSLILLRSSYPDPQPVTYKSVSPALPRTPDLYIQRPTHLCMGGWLTFQI